MAAEPLSRFPAARTSDCDEAQEALTATFLPLRMRMAERPDSARWACGSTRFGWRT
jgi:hypothetical protein